jgi:hypothetical protein
MKQHLPPKTFIDGDIVHEHNLYTNVCSQRGSVILNGRYPLIANNIICFRKCFSISLSFLRSFVIERNLEMALGTPS